MPRDTPEQRRQARVVHQLRIAAVALAEAKLELTGRETKQARAIDNAMQATEYALRGPRVLSSEPVSDDPSGADK